MRKLHIITFLAAVLVLSNRCSKNDNSPVAYRTVDLYVHLADPSNVRLNSPGGWVYIDGGVRGIVLYRLSNEDFVALDRNCTYNSAAANAIVSVDNTGIILKDTSCKSQFQLVDGAVKNGPATIPLKHYTTEVANNIVHIYN